MASATDGWDGASLAPDDFEVVDLLQSISAEMAAWRGTERTEISQEQIDVANSFPGGQISATYLRTVAHSGTHVDADRHFFPEGLSIDGYPIDRFVCRGVAIDIPLTGPRSFLFVMGPFSIPGADASPVVPVALLTRTEA